MGINAATSVPRTNYRPMRYALLFTLIIITLHAQTQPLAKITVHAGETDRIDCPVGISLDQINYNQDEGSLILTEITGGEEVPVPCQLDAGHAATLWFILSGITPGETTRQFVLENGEIKPDKSSIHLMKRHGQLRIQSGDRPILDYQFLTVYPPEGINALFKRSGFIHPLWSPGGQELTRIQPPDHYHHYGIWGPWTKTHIMGREVDFWNLMKGQGTVKFSGFISRVEGPVFTGFKALQEHVDFGARGEDQVALNEVLDVRAWNIGNGHIWLIDYTTTLNTPLDSGIVLDAYRYGGGIGFRATEAWHKDNSTVLTSENKDRLTADGTKAKWCMVEGESISEEGRSGILFMGHPANREFPEPMRVWPLDANRGRGDVYFQFCPIRHNDWILQKGEDYTLKYRLLVFDGAMTSEESEIFWKGFGEPPAVVITPL
jgi:hypothetical protein